MPGFFLSISMTIHRLRDADFVLAVDGVQRPSAAQNFEPLMSDFRMLPLPQLA
jgi:hypothetical protein